MTDADSSRIVASVDDAALLWQCVSGSLVMGVSTGAFLSSAGDEVFVRYRFDKEPAESPQMWAVDANNTLAVAPLEFVPAINSRAIKAEQLAFEIVDYEGASHYATFALSGFEDALKNLSCAN